MIPSTTYVEGKRSELSLFIDVINYIRKDLTPFLYFYFSDEIEFPLYRTEKLSLLASMGQEQIPATHLQTEVMDNRKVSTGLCYTLLCYISKITKLILV